jgi:hypothetical protein
MTAVVISLAVVLVLMFVESVHHHTQVGREQAFSGPR